MAIREMLSSKNSDLSSRGYKGKPRKSGARYRSGELRPVIDEGHETTQERRKALVGGNGLDACAGYPGGIIYRGGLISENEHDAGLRYARLHRAAYGSGSVASHLGKLAGGMAGAVASVADHEGEGDARRRLAEAVAAIGPGRSLRIIQNVFVYEQGLRFMDTARRRTSAACDADHCDIRYLRGGLQALARLWKISTRGD